VEVFDSAAALRPQVAETHTGLVVLVGEYAYKVKKPVTTDFLDFSTPASRERACAREVMLNSRLAPDSYLGVAHFQPPQGGAAEPVIVMRRHPDECRLATMVRRGDDVRGQLTAIAGILARFHAGARRGREVDEQAGVEAVGARWQENLTELTGYASGVVPGLDPDVVAEIRRRAMGFLAGRAALFARRISDHRIVDGHADLLADDIFCLPEGPALLDCLEFDDRLRYVDGVDDAAFLAMDLEFLGRADLAAFFMGRYLTDAGDAAPESLRHFYIAYRAAVRAKVDCVRHAQGSAEAAGSAQAHLEIARAHLREGTVRLIVVGGGPGTGKTTLARGLAAPTGGRAISTDDVRSAMVARGEIAGRPGVLGQGLYSRENIEAVYDTVLRQAHSGLCEGHTVILDGTWTDPNYRERARRLAAESAVPIVELVCAAPLDATVSRIRTRTATTSQVTGEIATALADHAGGGQDGWPGAQRIDTTRELAESVAEALDICRTAC
jgi:aminoglycoside phosphotransferase family enzyme/predicted kinase